MADFDFSDYQSSAKRTAIYPKGIGILYCALGLTGEAGEVANKIKKIFRDHNGNAPQLLREQIFDELGDVLWYVAMLCEEFNFDLQLVMEYNLAKLEYRHNSGTVADPQEYMDL